MVRAGVQALECLKRGLDLVGRGHVTGDVDVGIGRRRLADVMGRDWREEGSQAIDWKGLKILSLILFCWTDLIGQKGLGVGLRVRRGDQGGQVCGGGDSRSKCSVDAEFKLPHRGILKTIDRGALSIHFQLRKLVDWMATRMVLA